MNRFLAPLCSAPPLAASAKKKGVGFVALCSFGILALLVWPNALGFGLVQRQTTQQQASKPGPRTALGTLLRGQST